MTDKVGTCFIRYETDTGRITAVGYCSTTDAQLQAQEGETALATGEMVDADVTYVLNGKLTDRTAVTATWDSESVVANGVAEIVLSPLPVTCTVYIDDTSVAVNDGSLEFSAEAAGQYLVYIDEPSFERKEWVVNAV